MNDADKQSLVQCGNANNWTTDALAGWVDAYVQRQTETLKDMRGLLVLATLQLDCECDEGEKCLKCAIEDYLEGLKL